MILQFGLDIFSLRLVLWDILKSNRHPFQVCTSSASLHIISHEFKASKFPAEIQCA